MAFVLKIPCSGEMHNLLFEDDGNIVVDPRVHDVDLERGLVELGGKPSECQNIAAWYRDDPIIVIEKVGYALGWDVHAHYVDWAKIYCGVHLCADSIVHACGYLDHSGHVTKFAKRAVKTVRNLYPFYPAKGSALPVHLDIDDQAALRHYTYDAIDLKGHFETHTPPKEMLVAVESMCSYAATFTYSATSIACVTVACAYTRATSTNISLSKEQYIGQGSEIREEAVRKESKWQARQVIRGISKLVEGKPWPSY
jgi:hypothetical protein